MSQYVLSMDRKPGEKKKKKKFDSASALAQGRKCIVANCLDLVSAIGISISHVHARHSVAFVTPFHHCKYIMLVSACT